MEEIVMDLQKKYYWEEHIKKWKQSNLTQTEYCKKNKLVPDHFSRWKNKILKANQFHQFIEIPRISNETKLTQPIEIIISDIFRINVTTGFDCELLKNIIQILKEIL
jgi:uncharacterized protein (UPF0335 family)